MGPLLSIVTIARNDNYMGNSNWRLETAINFLSIELDKLNRLKDVELIIVDWGSEIPLSVALTLNEQAKRIARFILVTRSVIDAIKSDSDFPAIVAMNAGVRRALGGFIMVGPADILFSERFFKRLFNILQGALRIGTPVEKSLFMFNRKDIPLEIVNQNLTQTALARYIEENDGRLRPTPIHHYYLCPAGALMMHRDLWRQSHAFDENLIYWGWADVDMVLRMRLRYFIADMSSDNEMYLYHLDHYTPGFVRTKMNYPSINPFVVNNERWGLADYSLEEVSKKIPLNLSDTPIDITDETHDDNKYFRLRHFMDLMKFFLKNPNTANLKLVFSHSAIILFQYPFMKKLFPLLKRIKKSPIQQ